MTEFSEQDIPEEWAAKAVEIWNTNKRLGNEAKVAALLLRLDIEYAEEQLKAEKHAKGIDVSEFYEEPPKPISDAAGKELVDENRELREKLAEHDKEACGSAKRERARAQMAIVAMGLAKETTRLREENDTLRELIINGEETTSHQPAKTDGPEGVNPPTISKDIRDVNRGDILEAKIKDLEEWVSALQADDNQLMAGPRLQNIESAVRVLDAAEKCRVGIYPRVDNLEKDIIAELTNIKIETKALKNRIRTLENDACNCSSTEKPGGSCCGEAADATHYCTLRYPCCYQVAAGQTRGTYCGFDTEGKCPHAKLINVGKN